jgi:glucose/arabinose dehydrogenase
MRHIIAILAVGLLPWLGEAATLPAGFSETTVSGLSAPTAMALAPDGRIFVCQQTGALRIIKNGTLLPAPFHTLTVDPAGERGLLGVAFDADFLSNHFVYVYYTVPGSPPHNRISRLTANGDVVVAASETVLLDLNDLSVATNHNGGALHFGREGKLYASIGENGNGANSQTLANLLGKMLRLNSDGTIPGDNPFFGSATGNNRAIWALGLRNPFTFAIHPLSGRMLINDVGQNTYEEIDEGIAGANYGWPTTEGPTTNPAFVPPIYYYGHGPACAIAGGAFYAGEVRQFPSSYVESYLFSDLCGGWIQRIDPSNPPAHDAATGFATGVSNPVDLLVGHDGSLFYLARGTGIVGRIRWNASLHGDADGDGSTANPDLFYLINNLYGGGAAPAAGFDADGNGVLNGNDLTYLVNYLLGRGPTPI